MHAALMSLVVAAGVGQVQATGPVVASPAPEMGYYASTGDCCGCQQGCQQGCGCDDCCGRATTSSGYRSCLCAWWGPMPQTCYAPRFGCYAGNNRHMHRYPAFHGYYYREPYNYRHLFDYPWHAAPHEPQGFLTYEVDRSAQPEGGIVPSPDPQMLPGGSGRLLYPTQPVPSDGQSQARLHRPAGRLVNWVD